jgi:signal transduction histidine kinase
VSRLTTLVNTLLDVSRASAGKMQLDLAEGDLAEIVTDSAERLRDDLERAHCELSMRVEAGVVGTWDQVRVDQVVTNLISNAIKYGAGKPIEITLSSTADTATLTVRDQGIGIAKQDHLRIFQRFARAVSPEHYGGLGLGLWIVRELVEAMGGKVRAEGEPGHGATFTVELPRRQHTA